MGWRISESPRQGNANHNQTSKKDMTVDGDIRFATGRRVLILVQNLPVPFDRRVWQEAVSLRRIGWDVSVICPSNDKHPQGQFQIDGVSVYRFAPVPEARNPLGYLREYTLSLLLMRKAIRILSRDGRFDVIHFCNPPDLLALLALEQKLVAKSRIIFDQHDLGPELVLAKAMPASWVLTRVARLFERIAYASANKVIATNESYREIAIRRGKKSPEDVVIVRSAPSRSWAESIPRNLKWRENHEYQIGYLGVIGQQEGLHFAIEALKILREKYSKDVFFTVVGSGTDVEKIKSLTKKLGLEDVVRFHGRLPDSEMKSALGSADVCINPDVFSDLNNLSTMNKIVEYMALGVPIVQFDLKEGKFSAQESSLYAEPDSSFSLAEKVNFLLDNHEVRKRMGVLGRTRFQTELCWEIQESKLYEVYESK